MFREIASVRVLLCVCVCVCVGSEMKRKFHQNNAHEYQSKRNCPGLATPSHNAHKVNELNGKHKQQQTRPYSLPPTVLVTVIRQEGRGGQTSTYRSYALFIIIIPFCFS